MPNHVTNLIQFEGEASRIEKLMRYIQCEGEDIGSFDFNKIIPMPETMNIESGSRQQFAVSIYLSCINPDTEDMGLEKMEKDRFSEIVKKIKKSKVCSFADKMNCNMKYDEVLEATTKCFENYDPNKPFNEGTMYQDDLCMYGKAIVDNVDTYDCVDWYDWSIKYWGTKWNAYNYGTRMPSDTNINFDTAWSAPHPVIEGLSKLFPDITIIHKWADEDCGNNCGIAEWLDGEGSITYKDEEDDAFVFAAEILGYDLSTYYRTKKGQYVDVDCDMPTTIPEEKYLEWKKKGFSFYGFKSKIKFDESTCEFDLSDLDTDDRMNLLRRMERKKIDVYEFFYY